MPKLGPSPTPSPTHFQQQNPNHYKPKPVLVPLSSTSTLGSVHGQSPTSAVAGRHFSGGFKSTVIEPVERSQSPAKCQQQQVILVNKQFLERRKTFRCRGSLGPTVASAPSVEQEDYRTPRPSVCSIGKNGKSFDYDGGTTLAAEQPSENNGLVKVSADFLRLNGSRQQFRSLLSRKKLGQMPPAYTQIDYSFESIESNREFSQNTAGVGPNSFLGRPSTTMGNHPQIRIDDAGCCAGAENNPLLDQNENPNTVGSTLKLSNSSSAINLLDSQRSSTEKSGPSENGNCLHHQDQLNSVVVVGGLYPPNSYGNGPSQHSLTPSPSSACFKRHNSRYGAPIDSTAVKAVYRIRSQRLCDRVRITDRSLILAMTGILLMVIDAEATGQNLFGIDKDHVVSLLLRSFVLLSTVALLVEIVHFHINEIMLDLVDCGADDWRVVLSWNRTWRFLVEFILCSVIPLPGTGTIGWSFVEPSRFRTNIDSGSGNEVRDVPVDIILSLLMLSRIYLFGRFCTLHSKQFQDASTRTLAALNRIQVNFTFVMKTALDQQPLLFISMFLVIFWLTTAWSFAQCERFGRDENPFVLYSNALWFIAITFNGNGYGDIVPKTLAGRLIAILVGISGAVISSILIAVISRKILLSQGQKNVNDFMNDSRLTLAHKNAAARVLQKTWHIYRCLQTADSPDRLLRKHQRQFLTAIHEFRRIKNKMRVFGESNTTSLQQMNRLMLEMHTQTQKLATAQEEMRAQLEVLHRTMRDHFVAANFANNSGGAINDGQMSNYAR